MRTRYNIITFDDSSCITFKYASLVQAQKVKKVFECEVLKNRIENSWRSQ